MENPDFLKEKFSLHNSPEVDKAAKRREVHTKEHVPQNPADRIQNYLDRFKEITDRTDPDKFERRIKALKHVLHDKFVIKPEQIPESYFENQRRIAREQGHGNIEITDEVKAQLAEVIVADQQSSLNNWIDYLTSPDATYPDWLKYYATRSILGMGEYDKDKKQFTKRSKGTTKPFPDLNREALAYVLDAIEKKYKGENINFAELETEDKEQFEKLLHGENFPKLYAWAIEKITSVPIEQLISTEGKWVKYEQGSDHMPLVKSLQGHGTGWCTAGESIADVQLKGGDFYVYYSLDSQGNHTIPRVAIRMDENSIAEVRGIATEQNLDPYIGSVVQEKLKEFPDGAAYEKKAQDMKQLTFLENKTKKGQDLTKDDLIFLYEIKSSIEGFGYQRDPRIAEMRAKQNPERDMLIIFECATEQIAHTPEEISGNTKAYVGDLTPGIFNILPKSIEHIYTTFPEGRIEKRMVIVGGKSKEELKKEIKEKFYLSPYAENMIDNQNFIVSQEPYLVDIVCLRVEDFGYIDALNTEEIYTEAQSLGLDLCSAEVGPYLRIQYENQPSDEFIHIAMKQIVDSKNKSKVFRVGNFKNEMNLTESVSEPLSVYYQDDKFAFCWPNVQKKMDSRP